MTFNTQLLPWQWAINVVIHVQNACKIFFSETTQGTAGTGSTPKSNSHVVTVSAATAGAVLLLLLVGVVVAITLCLVVKRRAKKRGVEEDKSTCSEHK